MSEEKNIDLEQKDLQEFILNKLGKEDWIEVYRDGFSSKSVTFWCALVKRDKVPAMLEKADWDFLIGYGRPGHIVYGIDEKRIFIPLRDDDKHLLATLHIPLNDEQAEFDAQVLALAKLIVDSLNESEIAKLLPSKIEKEKGISKLDRFLKVNGFTDEPIITFLRELYRLRHGVGHRKGDDYEKAAEFFGVGKRPLKDVFVEILIMATELLQRLDRKFIGTKED